MNRRCGLLVLLLFSVAAPSCNSVNNYGLEAVSPQVEYVPRSFETWVYPSESLQPTLEWKSTEPGATSFDLLVCKGIPHRVKIGFTNRIKYYKRGPEVLKREGINASTYRLEHSLEPDTVYVWAVRTRLGSESGDWSHFDYTKGLFGNGGKGSGLWWRFKTPSP